MNIRPGKWLPGLAALIGLAGSGFAAESLPKLQIGDSAPPFKVSEWAKGPPVEKLERGKVYVLEFWATRCSPCIKHFPHLNALAKQYAGRVTFIGVNYPYSFENADNIRTFVEKKADLLNYPIAIDDKIADDKRRLFSTWATPAGVGTPGTFVVDREGKIAWVNQGPTGVDEVLAQVVAGTYDLKAARAQLEAEKAKDPAKYKASNQAQAKMLEARKAKNWPEVVAELDKLTANIRPGNKDNDMLFYLKLDALMHMDEQQALAFAKSVMPDLSPQYRLSSVVQMAAAAEKESGKFSAATNAFIAQGLESELKNTVVTKPNIVWELLAQTYYRLGQIDQAIGAQEKAIETATSSAYEQEVQQYRVVLDKYRSEKMPSH